MCCNVAVSLKSLLIWKNYQSNAWYFYSLPGYKIQWPYCEKELLSGGKFEVEVIWHNGFGGGPSRFLFLYSIVKSARRDKYY